MAVLIRTGFITVACCAAGLALADESTEKSELSEMEQRFRKSAQQYSVYTGENGKKLELVKRPILNWSNPERLTNAGAIFLWTDAGRPQVAMCIYPNESTFDHEFQSLSTDLLRAEFDGKVAWHPAEPGLQHEKVDISAEVSPTSPVLRLRQMKFIARQFSATVGPRGETPKPLRLMERPLYRYPRSDGKQKIVDGAVFAFVQGTDPEVLLMVEAVKDGSQEGLQWQYGLARMSMVPLQVRRDDQLVWEMRWAGGNPSGPYYTIKGMK